MERLRQITAIINVCVFIKSGLLRLARSDNVVSWLIIRHTVYMVYSAYCVVPHEI